MMEIKNLKKVSERILKAIKKKEKIILYGDADLDGTTAVIILKESIKNLGGKITAIYFPDREKEGYGINQTAISYLKKFAPALLIVVDCGIGNFKEVVEAKRIGLEVIIIDHHEVLDKLPQAEIIVDPKQKGDRYFFKVFATAGIVFKLSEVLLGNRMTEVIRKNFLELAALATIADMMPQKDENKVIIDEGMNSLRNSWRPGLKAFFEIKSFEEYSDLSLKVSKMISILNVRDVKNRLPASFRLLTSPSLKGAKKIISELLDKNRIRKEKIQEALESVEKKIFGKENLIIFEGSSSFDLTMLSSVASMICRDYQKPVFLYKKMTEESQGTVRTPGGTDAVALMKKCKKHLISYGGHPQAGGFRVKNENLDKFKDCLVKSL